VQLLLKKGFKRVLVEEGAGSKAQFTLDQYKAAGATIVNRDAIFSSSDILLKVRAPLLPETGENGVNEVELIKEGTTLISFLYPAQNTQLVEAMAKRKINLFAMDCVPRISRAQVFDALRCVQSSIMRTSPRIADDLIQLNGKYCRIQGCFRSK
jgi:NAD(P) transhydrogenase